MNSRILTLLFRWIVDSVNRTCLHGTSRIMSPTNTIRFFHAESIRRALAQSVSDHWSSCGCFLLRQLFLVQKSLEHTRGAARERRARVIGSCLSQGGHLFLRHFLELFFSLKIVILDEKRYQNGIKMRSYGAYFLEKMQKRKSVFRLHRRERIACEPIPWSAQGDPKIKEKT